MLGLFRKSKTKTQDLSKGYDPYMGLMEDENYKKAFDSTIKKLTGRNILPKQIVEMDLSQNENKVFVVEELDGKFSSFKILRSPLDVIIIHWFEYTHGQILFHCHGSFTANTDNRDRYNTYNRLIMALAKMELYNELENEKK